MNRWLDGSPLLSWRRQFLRNDLERDIPQLGPRIPAETLRRFWTMLAHGQASLLNAAQLGRALAVDGRTVGRYLDLLVAFAVGAPAAAPGFHQARGDLRPERTFVVIPAELGHPLGDGVEAVGVAELAGLLWQQGSRHSLL